MKISCPACSAKYSIADDKVQERLAKIRCRKCGATIVIDGKTTPPHVYTTQGEATDMAEHGDAGGPEYSVDFGEGDQRNMSVRELVSAYNSGRVTGETFVWTEGFGDWKPLADVPEIVEALSAPATGTAPSPWASKPVASAPRTAARTSGGRSATADLFGGIDSAGSEDDVATSAPDHAPSPHAGSSAGGGGSSTGARNESSVLFSLSALTSAAQQTSRPSTRPSAASTTSTSRDDSGLIDLKALTAAAMKSDAGAAVNAAPLVPAMVPMPPPLGITPPPLGVSPFGGGITATTDIGYPQQKSKAPIFIGAGLAVGLIAVALAIVFKPQPPPPPVVAAPVATVPVTPPPAPSPTQEAAPAPDSNADTAAAASAAAKPAPRAGGSYRRPSTGAKKPPAGGDEPAAAAKPAAPPPKKSACGCGPADLQCAMRCAAK